ncbi:MAG: DEAD/DEAH box helicase [Enterobacteriaceae bacterium]
MLKKNLFYKFKIKDHIIKSINDINYVNPFEIQKICIPYLLKRRDVLGIAQTGSGKTAAFLIPLINNLNENLKLHQVLILSPTRELAIQTKNFCNIFTKYEKKIKTVIICGGQSYSFQENCIKNKPQIIVGTPGRMLDFIKRKKINLSCVKNVILDEADEMLKMGFIEDIRYIFNKINKDRHVSMFSATMSEEIIKISKEFMKFPKKLIISNNSFSKPNIKQYYWVGNKFNKNKALIKFLDSEDFQSVIIFVKTKKYTSNLSDFLNENGYLNYFINGDISQKIRENIMYKFKKNKKKILVATDLISRGIDIKNVNLVINYDIPKDYKTYIHRIGRTGRAGNFGKSILLLEFKEIYLLNNILKKTNFIIKRKKIPSLNKIEMIYLNKFLRIINKINLNKNDLDKYIFFLNKILKLINKDIKFISLLFLKFIFMKNLIRLI